MSAEIEPRADRLRKKRQPATVLWPLLALFVLLMLVASESSAQESARFPLRGANATTLAPQVESILKDLAPSCQVFIDRQSNGLIVRGPADSIRVAEQLIETLDRPAVSGGAPTAQPPKVQAYQISPENYDWVETDLRSQFAPGNSVRFAIDRRTGQLVVIAPPSAHQQIAQLISERQGATPAPPVAPNQEHNAARDDIYELQNITWRDLEDALARIWGGRDRIITSRNGEVATVELDGSSNAQAAMQIDRRRDLITLTGAPQTTRTWRKLVQALDKPPAPSNVSTQLVRLNRADPNTIQYAISVVEAAGKAERDGDETSAIPLAGPAGKENWGGMFVARIFQPPPGQSAAPGQPPAQPPGGGEAAAGQQPGGLFGDVQIEFVPELGVVIIRGRPDDVRRVEAIIAEIESQSATTRPSIEVLPMKHADGAALVELINPIYESVFAPRQGPLSITALVRPNALLLIGRSENIEEIRKLIEMLDAPLEPEVQLKVFRLQYMAAVDAEARLTTFFTEPAGLDTRVRVVADYRSNSLIVQASPRDLDEVDRLLKQLDVQATETVAQIKIFPLKNTLAADLQAVLLEAIAPAQDAGQGQATQPSGRLEILGIDDRGNKIIESGVMADVAITADATLNAIVVRAPEGSMELIGQLIRQLDKMPEAEAQIKVFQIEYGDATNLASMMQQLFGQQVTAGAQGTINTFGAAFGFNQPGVTGAAAGEGSLVPLTFAVEQRTNSIVVSGSTSDLTVVEAILVRLDEGDLRQRKTIVYRLNNAPAQNVATALTNILTRETQLIQQQQQQLFALISPYEFIDQQVFVEPEIVSNSLIVSATPQYFDQVIQVIDDLDRRPPMVMVHVILAEVELDELSELGVELGLQDSLLFDRSVTDGGLLDPGYLWSGQPPGNSSSDGSLATAPLLAGQAFGNFLVGTTSAAGGFPGMILTASNDSINILVRALEENSRAQILGRPTIMALNNFPASVLVGERVPRVTDISQTNTGTISGTELVDTGLSLGIIPRVTPDGLVVMDLEVSKSRVGPVEDGIPIGATDGVPILSPIFRDTTAITTLSARSGQTVVFAGLITDDRTTSHRGIPYLSDIPILGRLFGFDVNRTIRRELLIFMTPYIVDDETDVHYMNVKESQRMSWCLADVLELLEDPNGIGGGSSIWTPDQGPVIFPDTDPHATGVAPTPAEEGGLQLPVEQPHLTPPQRLQESKPFFDPLESGQESKPFFDSSNPSSRRNAPNAMRVIDASAQRHMPRPLPYVGSGPPLAPGPEYVSPVRYQQSEGRVYGQEQAPPAINRLPWTDQ